MTGSIEAVTATLLLFLMAALFEVGGGHMVWQWVRLKKSAVFGLAGALALFAYGILPTLQSTHFGRVYAAYGGVFLATSVLWGFWINKKRPDKYTIIGALIVLMGVVIIMYAPR